MSSVNLQARTARIRRPLSRLVPLAAAVMALAAPLASHAGSGELLDSQLPSAATPVDASQSTSTLTRAEVREALKMARDANMLTPVGEIGDTPEVLQAREDFNALQTEVRMAEWQRYDEAVRVAQLEEERDAQRPVAMLNTPSAVPSQGSQPATDLQPQAQPLEETQPLQAQPFAQQDSETGATPSASMADPAIAATTTEQQPAPQPETDTQQTAALAPPEVYVKPETTVGELMSELNDEEVFPAGTLRQPVALVIVTTDEEADE